MATMKSVGPIYIYSDGKVIAELREDQIEIDNIECEPFEEESDESIFNPGIIVVKINAEIEDDGESISHIDQMIWGHRLN